MNDDDLLRYSRHLLLDDIRHRRPAAAARRARAGHRRRRAGLAGRAVPRHGRRRPDHHRRRRRGRPHQPAAADRARPVARSASPRPSRRRATRRARSIPTCDVDRPARARRRAALLDALVAAADVVLDCSDNFAHPPRRQRGCVTHAQAAGRRRRDRLRRPDLGLRHCAAPTRPATPALFPPDAAFEDVRCADDGRVRAAGRHHRQHAGGRGAEAPGWHRASLAGRLQMLDARTMEWTEIQCPRSKLSSMSRSPLGATRIQRKGPAEPALF